MLVDFDLWLIVDANGDYAVGTDADTAKEAYANDIGELAEADGFRLVKVTCKIPLPTLTSAAAEVAEDEPAEARAAG